MAYYMDNSVSEIFISQSEDVKNTSRLIKESSVDVVKPEGGENMILHIKAMVNAGILDQGHTGLLYTSGERMEGRVGLQADRAEAESIGNICFPKL